MLTLEENTVMCSLVHATLWSFIWDAQYALLWLFCHCSVTSLTFECKFFFYKKNTMLWWDRHAAMPEGIVFRVLITCNSIGLLSLVSSLSLPVSLTQALGEIPTTTELHNASSISVRMGRSHMRLYTRDDSGTNSEAHMDDLAVSSESASVPRCRERISGLKRKVFHLVQPLPRNNG